VTFEAHCEVEQAVMVVVKMKEPEKVTPQQVELSSCPRWCFLMRCSIAS